MIKKGKKKRANKVKKAVLELTSAVQSLSCGGAQPQTELTHGGARPRRAELTHGGAQPQRDELTHGGAQPQRDELTHGGAQAEPQRDELTHGGAQPQRAKLTRGGAQLQGNHSQPLSCGGEEPQGAEMSCNGAEPPCIEAAVQSPKSPCGAAELAPEIDNNLLAKWPRLTKRVPTIFLHKTVDFATYVNTILKLDIKFYQPYLTTSYTKIICPSLEDHKALLEYFDEHCLPYHTFGPPNDLNMRVVIRGLPVGTNLSAVAASLRAAGLPLVRTHRMHVKQCAAERDLLVLAVVPYTEAGRNILRVQSVLGHRITLEPARHKTQQCHRCQKWGHVQRYCHGTVLCVKCAGQHWSQQCPRDTASSGGSDPEPPTCANCGGAHTASYRQCFHCPDAAEYRRRRRHSRQRSPATPRQLVTVDIADQQLYRKIHHIPKHTEAIPF